ncbi:MAG: hypothetical protein ACLGIF_03055 [Actinomycetes bacterium]
MGTVTLTAGSEALRVTGRLQVLCGDLVVEVVQPDGRVVVAGSPWPVDAGPYALTLAPGAALAVGVPLISSRASQPVVDQAGAYTVRARFAVTPGSEVAAGPVALQRRPATDLEQAAALRERDVVQSLMSVSVLGSAGPALARMAAGPAPVARVLARMATGTAPADTAADLDEEQLAATVTAVLPPDLYGGDERAARLLATADRLSPRAAATLAGRPLPA